MMAGRRRRDGKEERVMTLPPLCSSLQVHCGGGEDSGAEQTQLPSRCVSVASFLVGSKTAYRPKEQKAKSVLRLNSKCQSHNAKEIFEVMLRSLNRFLWQADRLAIQMILPCIPFNHYLESH